MKLNESCINALREPSNWEHRLASSAAEILQKRSKGWFSGGMVLSLLAAIPAVPGLVSLKHSVFSDSISEHLLFITVLGVIWLFLFGCICVSCYRKLRLANAIRSGDYLVATGKCQRSSGRRSLFTVYGCVGDANRTNLRFTVDTEVIKAMPRNNWDFLLISSARQATVVMVAPDGELLLAEGIASAWSQYTD